MKELLERLKAPMNAFWKKTVAILLTISLLLSGVSEVIQPMLHDALIPEDWKPVLRIIYAMGYFGALMGMLTKKDSSDDTPAQ
jgi:hypothetical protein